MAEAPHTTEGTEAPGGHEAAGFPPFKTETFPSQFFWLAVTFIFLFVVLWRVAGPRIAGTITARRGRINDDLAQAQAHRGDAQAALADYQAKLTAARNGAQRTAEEARKTVQDELARAKSIADAKANDDIAQAETRIAGSRNEARAHVANAARDAAIDIVARLTGETVSADDAAAAVRAATGS